MRGVVQYLLHEYKSKKGRIEKDEYVRKYIRRPVVTMEETFAFLGAQPSKPSQGNQIPSEFAVFRAIKDASRTGLPGRFDGTGYSDELVIKKRRDVIETYLKELSTKGKIGKGFRG
jgi:hypothetical protein